MKKAQFSKALARWGTQAPAEIDEAADRLLDEARAASKLRSYAHDPDVSALFIEHTRERVERVLLVAMTFGLLCTTVNVQAFVAGDAVAWSLAWCAAWLVEPFITAGVLSLLRIEQVARRNQVVPGNWVRYTRWAAFGATYLMNTWSSWFGAVFVPSQVFKHTIIPVLVFCFAEALTDGRDALTKAATRISANRVWGPAPQPEVPEVPFVVPPNTNPNPVTKPEETDEIPDVVPITRHPKGHLKNVRLPEVLRELQAQGRGRDSVTTAEVDTLLPATKYVTRAMINSAWPEGDSDGAVNE